jgi:hypothetical protein
MPKKKAPRNRTLTITAADAHFLFPAKAIKTNVIV